MRIVVLAGGLSTEREVSISSGTLVADITQVELARSLSVSKQSISNWENDNILPSIEMLVKIADFFSVSTDYLLGLDDKKYLLISGLNEEQIAHIQQLVDDIAENNQK